MKHRGIEREIAPDFWVVAIDDTLDWIIPEKYKEHILAIGTNYLYDRNLHVNCCSVSPSMELYRIDVHAVYADYVYENEALMDELDNWINSGWIDGPDVIYMSIGAISNVSDRLQYNHGGADHCETFNEAIQELVEEFQCDTPATQLLCEVVL